MALTNKKILILNNQGLDEPGGGVTISKVLIDHFSVYNEVTFLSEGSEKAPYVQKNLNEIKLCLERYEEKAFMWRFAPILRSFALKRKLQDIVVGYDIIIVLDCKYFPGVQKYSPHSLNIYLSLSAIPIVALKNVEGGWLEKVLTFLQYALIERYAFQKSDISFVSSQTHLNEVKKYECIQKQPFIVYPFIEARTSPALPSSLSGRQLKKKLGIEGKYVILTVARITKLKNIEYLLQLAERIEREDIVFLVIGEGGHKTSLEKQINTKELQQKIILYGHHENPGIFYQIADIYIHPSFYESFACVIHEAMLAGLPVIFPKNILPYISAFEELVQSEEALALDFSNQLSVMNTIITLLEHADLRQRFGENAREKAECFKRQYHSYSQRVEQIIQDTKRMKH